MMREEIVALYAAFKRRIKEDANFRTELRRLLKKDAAEKTFGAICLHSLYESLAHSYPGDNYDAGQRKYQDEEFSISYFDAKLILLSEADASPLKQYVQSLIRFERGGLTRTAAYLGLPTERRQIDSQQSLFNLAKNFIGYKEGGNFFRNFFASLVFITWHLTIVSIKVFLSTFKILTEFVPYSLKSFSETWAEKAYACVDNDTPPFKKYALYAAYYIGSGFSILFHTFYFFGRAIFSPAKGVMAAAREGGLLGDWILGKSQRTWLGDVFSTLFAVTSLTMTVFAYLTIFPIKLTISFTTTIPFLARHLPAFIVKPISFIVDKITPTLNHIGDILGKVFDPIVGPVSRALHEHLTFMEVGLGGCAGIASAAAETSYTLFGSKVLKSLAVGLVSSIVAATGMLVALVSRKKMRTAPEDKHTHAEEPITPSTTTQLLKVMPKNEKSPTMQIGLKADSPKILPKVKTNVDSLSLTPLNYNHTQTTQRIAPTR